MNQIRTAVVAALAVAILGACAANSGGTAADPAARQEADQKKQKELAEMEKAGKRD